MLKSLLIAIALLVAASVTLAQDTTARTAPPDPNSVQLTEVARGFHRPILVTNAGDGSGRVFVMEQSGAVKIISGGQVVQTPFLDVSGLISPSALRDDYSEQGLLGLAFHPNYEENGLFYINYTDTNGNTVVAQYHVSDDPNVADPNSAIVVLTQQQPYSNHNGGNLVFGPDGYLYIGFGDGGSQGDPNENAQNPAVWLGKILRIDVHEDGTYTTPADNAVSINTAFAPEIWAYGLRNPWRFTFDAATGDLYIGDVGGDNWEEIDFRPAGSPSGANYGWDGFEGNHVLEGDVPEDQVTFPVAEYNHGEGITVVGGYVYRGELLPGLQGAYFYADWGSGHMWSLYQDASGNWIVSEFLDTQRSISSFGVDEQNELYITDYYSGTVLQFMPA